MTDIQQIFQMCQRSTASGRGQSYWQVAQNCGERRYLSDLHKALAAADDAQYNQRQKNRGTYFHALMDFWQKGQIPSHLVFDASAVQDSEFANACRLFSFVRQHFPQSYFGDYVASEIQLPAREDHKAKIKEWFGHDESTGALDALYILDDSDCVRIEHDFPNVTLSGPGLYAYDWKASDSRVSDAKASGAYTNSIQAKLYPTLWNLAGGERIKGMIYFVIVDHAELRRHDENPKKLSSVQMFYTPHTEMRALQARSAINFAWEMRNKRTKNPYACEDYSGKRCPFLYKFCDGI